MDAIIRAAAVASEPRALRRTASAVAAPQVARPATSVAPVPPVPPVPEPQELARAHQQQQQAQQRMQEEHETALHAMRQQEQQFQQARQQLSEEAAAVLADAERRGYALGQEKGEAEARAMVAAQVERLAHLVTTLTQARRQLLDEAEDLLVEIAFAAVCRIVGPTLITPAGMAAMVHSLLQQTREPEQLSVRLHPDDLDLLSADQAGLAERLTVQADASIQLGGCLIDSPRGTLDARLELQMEQLAAALRQARRERAQDEAGL